eukprot:CAMPEP_0119357224 /NCGR_PEP_ID=MMETSP1334-20130426/5669_1 /TAXON_ID=127549 /ORGANISM="Calcidiscus leptoporus, Strain RCC1130" /LENGTH=44 /DNA_ID= /DNA_START= /DNA_END= /DNA_ORIENTATION=
MTGGARMSPAPSPKLAELPRGLMGCAAMRMKSLAQASAHGHRPP